MTKITTKYSPQNRTSTNIQQQQHKSLISVTKFDSAKKLIQQSPTSLLRPSEIMSTMAPLMHIYNKFEKNSATNMNNNKLEKFHRYLPSSLLSPFLWTNIEKNNHHSDSKSSSTSKSFSKMFSLSSFKMRNVAAFSSKLMSLYSTFLTTVLLINCFNISSVLSIQFDKSAYHDIVIDIRNSLPAQNCSKILHNLENAFSTASKDLHTALDGRAYFDTIIVNLPSSWGDECIPNYHNTTVLPSTGEKSDITLTDVNRLFGDRIWTQQSGGCEEPGDQIYVPHTALHRSTVGKELIAEWAKYRYGVFDEMGYDDDKVYPRCYFTDRQLVTGCSDAPIRESGICQNSNPFFDMTKTIDKRARSSIMFVPQAENIVMFCDEGTHDRYAPTKHNLMCGRRSTLEIILKHPDFNSDNIILTDTTTNLNYIPKFEYRRRILTRYVVIIDETQDSLVRESWKFLRNALRKWVVYDLQPNTEVGVVLANDTAVGRMLDIMPLNNQKNRDLIASFIPYTPSDSRQSACISCAIKESIDLLIRRRIEAGPASDVILIIAPGMDVSEDYEHLAKEAVKNKARIATINFPHIVHASPLDKLAELTSGIAFTVHEKKYNSEVSYLDTYFELTSVLYHISGMYFEGEESTLPVEIHRKKLVDIVNDSNSSKRISRVISGGFYMTDYLRTPSGFYIYTHNVEQPLIQNVKLTSPSGLNYGTRSDQRMPVKQLTLLALINSTGPWTYMIERFNGNPQPHFVQVFATPVSETAPVVKARSWLKRLKNGGPLIILCEVKRGDYPVYSANVEVIVTRPDMECNYTNNCEERFNLLDTGAGDPDVTKGDGIYSRYYSFANTSPGLYKFDIIVDDNGSTAHSLQDNSPVLNLPCCGSSIVTRMTHQMAPFQRYLPSMTTIVTADQISQEHLTVTGKIVDLVVVYLDEEKIRLTWTAPDMGGHGVSRYDVKYAFNIRDITDNYETNALPWLHDTPYPFSVGDMTSFVMDINLQPELFGEAVFFAVRPYSKLVGDAIPGPISNPVRTFIPNKIKSTPPSGYRTPNDGDWSMNGIGDGNDDSSQMSSSDSRFPTGNAIDYRIRYLIPAVAGILFVILIVVMYCFFCVFRPRQQPNKARTDTNTTSPSKTHPKDTKSDSNSNAFLYQENTMNGGYHSPKNGSLSASPICHQDDQQYQHQQDNGKERSINSLQTYSTVDAPDPHTVGIPIYADDDLPKKRLSLSNNIHDHSPNMEPPADIIPVPSIYAKCANGPSGNVSIISSNSNTLTRQGRTLSPYESWTATQLLHEHERRHSSSDDNNSQQQHPSHAIIVNGGSDQLSINMSLNDGVKGIPPPVPPLPYQTAMSADGNYHSNYYYPNIYSIHSGTITTMSGGHGQPPPPPTPQPSNYSTMSINQMHATTTTLIPNSANLNSNQNAIGAGIDKKRRNVTMV